jgi:hypothetical protein
MPVAQPQQEFQALCHEHHAKMRLGEVHLKGGGEALQIIAYACVQPDCRVHYNISRGYFLANESATAKDFDMAMLPRVRCPRDGTPMYLAETDRAKKGFRLWVCPQCDARHTNEDDLVGEETEAI